MASERQETHWWSDGHVQHLYTERAADARHFTAWFGKATKVGLDHGSPRSWWWEGLPKDTLRLRRRRQSLPKTPEQIQALRSQLALTRARTHPKP